MYLRIMNCPACSNRNPSNANRCLHCGATLKAEEKSLFNLDNDEGGNKLIYIFLGGIAVLIFGGGILFGFDTATVECTSSDSKIASYEAAPEWVRDTSAESRERDRERDRERERRKRKDVFSSSKNLDNLQCFKKITGHVKGIVED